MRYDLLTEPSHVRQAYDEVAETDASARSETGQGTEILAEFLNQFSADPTILDAGCGQGRPVFQKIDTAATGAGLDFSRRQLELAAENVPGVRLVQGDLTRLPLLLTESPLPPA